MKPRIFFVPILLLLGIALGACRFLGTGAADAPETANVETVMTYDRLVSALEEAGATVEPVGEVMQPFFSITGKTIQVNGGEVQVFEFGDANASREAAESVSPNGSSVGTTIVSWLATPHFYKTDNLIALYVGDDPAVMKLLETYLGPQFAGG